MKLKYSLDNEFCYPPEKAHEADAGWDLRAPNDVIVYPGWGAKVFTGVHVHIPEGHVGLIKSRSSLNIKADLVCEGVIDSGYTGEIVVKLHTFADTGYLIRSGDKVAQLVIVPICQCHAEQVDLEELEKEAGAVSDRGTGGFGSTGR